MQDLRNQQTQKRSHNITIDSIKETFQKTELTDDTKKKPSIFARAKDSKLDPKKEELAKNDEIL